MLFHLLQVVLEKLRKVGFPHLVDKNRRVIWKDFLLLDISSYASTQNSC